jgi:hypothetical protein
MTDRSMIHSASSRPAWLARPGVGMAHAFDLRVQASCCGKALRGPHLSWEPATGARTRCSSCEAIVYMLKHAAGAQ